MYSYHDRVSYSRIDKDGLLGVSDTVNAMQDCCLFHSEDVGHSALDLLKKNRAWLVSAWHVVFKRRPVMGERFTVHTWPYQFKGIFGCRNFLMETRTKRFLPTPIQDGFILTRLPVSQQKLMTVKRPPIRQNLLTTWNILLER